MAKTLSESLTDQVIRLTAEANIQGYNIDNPDCVYRMTQWQLEELVRVTKNDAIMQLQPKISRLLTKAVIK
jgi:hypothetical protein